MWPKGVLTIYFLDFSLLMPMSDARGHRCHKQIILHPKEPKKSFYWESFHFIDPKTIAKGKQRSYDFKFREIIAKQNFGKVTQKSFHEF